MHDSGCGGSRSHGRTVDTNEAGTPIRDRLEPPLIRREASTRQLIKIASVLVQATFHPRRTAERSERSKSPPTLSILSRANQARLGTVPLNHEHDRANDKTPPTDLANVMLTSSES